MFWHRPHHIAVDFPQRIQGLLISVTASIVCSNEGEVRKGEKGGEESGILVL